MSPDRRIVLPRLAAAFGLLCLAATGVLYAVSGLLAPGWAVLLLMAGWIAMIVLGIRWLRPHPWRVLVLPLVALGLWVLVITLGERLLGWTA